MINTERFRRDQLTGHNLRLLQHMAAIKKNAVLKRWAGDYVLHMGSLTFTSRGRGPEVAAGLFDRVSREMMKKQLLQASNNDEEAKSAASASADSASFS